MSNVVGYARVSRHDQNPAAQEAELRAAGAWRVFVDQGESSRIKDRPQWLACLDYLRPGDTLVVRRLDRIAGSEKMAIETINDLHERGVNIKSLTEPDIDTRHHDPDGACAVRHRCGVRSVARGHDPGEHQARAGARPRPGSRWWPPVSDDSRAHRRGGAHA